MPASQEHLKSSETPMPRTEPALDPKTYFEERKTLIEMEVRSAESFDKAMITLSAGALGLSITFLHDIAPHPRLIWLLWIAWGGFILSLLSTLLSFLLSQWACRRQRDILDSRSRNEPQATEQPNRPAQATGILNWASIICFIAGVVFMAIFSIRNLE